MFITMGGYFDGTLGSDPVHQDRPHHGARLIDLRGRRRNSEAFVRKYRRNADMGPTSTDHLNLRGKSHSAAKPAAVTILPRWAGHSEGEKVC
jgi:hypothetical protein